MNGLYPSHHSLKTCTTSMVKMLHTCPFWKPFSLPMSSSRSQGDTLPGEIATGGIPTSLQMPHIPTQVTWRPTSPRLGRPATPSMASQPQHLLDQTKGVWSRQIPCWRQVCVSIQSHLLLPASHNKPSSSFSFWIETSWRREHATHHKFFAQAIALRTPGELATPSQTNLNMKGTRNFSSTPSSPTSCPYTTSSTWGASAW